MPSDDVRLLLLRHGATAWNDEERIIGSSDLPLNACGRLQAAQLAHRVAPEHLDYLYTSPLRRAQETAALVEAACGLRATTDERLRETDFGAWEGLTMAEAEQRYAAAVAAWRAAPTCAPTGGEPPADLQTRVRAFLRDMRARHAGQTVGLVSHGGILQALLFLALDLPFRNDWVFLLYNGSLSELALGQKRSALVYLNDIAHLQPAGPSEPEPAR